MEMATPWKFLPRPNDRDFFGATVRDPSSMRRRFAFFDTAHYRCASASGDGQGGIELSAIPRMSASNGRFLNLGSGKVRPGVQFPSKAPHSRRLETTVANCRLR